MAELLTLDNLFTLLVLIFLQAVLGFDNLLYISIESKRVPEDRQSFVRRVGIGLAVFLRIALLFVVVYAIESFRESFFSWHLEGIFEIDLNLHALIVLVGGVFIIYTAFKEITHMLSIEHMEQQEQHQSRRSPWTAIGWIVAMNLVFSFDSILSAVALTDNLVVMATAIVIGGILMIVLADEVAEFLKRNRMYEVLGLFILFIVGVMLLSEGGHLAHLHLGGFAVEAMTKTTFYFTLIMLVLVDLAQTRYRKKLRRERQRELAEPGH